MNTDKLKVYLCRDHFARLVDGNTCETCPSKIENKFAVEALAKARETEESGIEKALVSEIHSIRRVLESYDKRFGTLERGQKHIDTAIRGADGNNGLNSRVSVIESRLRGSSRNVAVILGVINLVAVTLLGIAGMILGLA